jgi:thioredoxin reductase (NADPH)
VILAMGVSYRRLGVDALEPLEGSGVFYGSSPAEAPQFTDRSVCVVGGGNAAGQAAVYLSRYAAQVTIVARRDRLSMSQYLRDEIDALKNVDVRLEAEVVDGGGDGRLEWITLRDCRSGATTTTATEALFVLIGARPHTEWLPPEITRDERGFVVTGADLTSEGAGTSRVLDRTPHAFETAVPGVFAVGDVRCRSVKRVASAVGEGSVVVQQLHEYLDRERGHLRSRLR